MFQNIIDAFTGDSDGDKKLKCGGDDCKKIKGTVVLMKKNVLDFSDILMPLLKNVLDLSDIFHASLLDRVHELLGQGGGVNNNNVNVIDSQSGSHLQESTNDTRKEEQTDLEAGSVALGGPSQIYLLCPAMHPKLVQMIQRMMKDQKRVALILPASADSKSGAKSDISAVPSNASKLLQMIQWFALLKKEILEDPTYLHKKLFHKLPPGPRGWPIIGAIPLLGTMPHVTLAKMAKRYGPVMYLKMGTCNMVVASTPDAARAFLKTLDLNFSNRPPNAGATHLACNAQDMVFADYGPRWKLLRKLSNLHLLGGKALEDWAHVRVTELGHMLRAMSEASQRGEPVVVPEMLTHVELMTSAGFFNIGDFIPSVAWLDLQGIERGMKKLHGRFDVLLTKMMEEHMATAHERKGKPDFLDVLMASHENLDGERLSFTNIKALLLNLFTAGTDTSSSIIEWGLAEMLKNPRILKRAQDEMDQVIGLNRRLQESDIPKLPYLQAICKEAFRKHPSTPLNLPRIADQACEVNGYYIPKGTRLSVNIWAIRRDPNTLRLKDFFSEKYAKINPRGNDFELILFGAGRRICAGTRMGIVLVEYILGTLVHSFDWKLPKDVELNMDEAFGLALQKAVPLSAMVNPHLEPNAYLA
ncbi:unnamed protein product [Dovyalis caffra]|uniref:Flavonoid 3',5'-hydroxylase n=1 Tax=Dovyalis caffra TaxID=77055 RepID=A0AAV1RBH8_9ROSI|nr:unnamed protein product [Dovyalis caffra]